LKDYVERKREREKGRKENESLKEEENLRRSFMLILIGWKIV
jgi:hypothetical protein